LPQSLKKGEVLRGRYKIRELIGQGGTGSIYLAEDTRLQGRLCAVKEVEHNRALPTQFFEQAREQFFREASVLARLDHPNLPKVSDFFSDGPRDYLVMDFVPGKDLRERMLEARHNKTFLPQAEVLRWTAQLADALNYLHQQDPPIIHRDIKPSNVLVTLHDGKPVPKVIDFGVAKATEQRLTERTLFTQYGTMVGTLEYMSPEQAEMSALGVDTRSDIFSLGVLLYELLTGNTPLDRKRVREAAYGEILRMIKEEEPPKPSTRLSDSGVALASISAQRQTEPAKLSKLMRGELDWIVMKTLEKDRNRRYETANGFAADVQRFLNNEAVHAGPSSARYRMAKFVRRHRGPVFAAALLLTVLLSGITGTTIGLIRAEQSRRVAVAARNAEQQQRQVVEKLADSERIAKERATIAQSEAETAAHEASKKASELETELYVNLVGRAQSDWLGGNVTDALRRLQECPPQLRQWEWNFVQKLCHLDRWTDAGNGRCVWSVAVSPDGSLVASGSGRYLWATQAGEGRLAVRSATDGRLVFHEDGLKGGVQGVAFSPDGGQLAACTGFWSPNGNSKEGELIVWELATQKRLWSRSISATEFLCVAYSQDGSKIAVGSGGYNSSVGDNLSVAIVHDAASGEQLRTFESSSGNVHCVAFSPDGRQIALGESEQVELFNVDDGRLVRRFGGHLSFVYAVAFSPDGSRLATGEYAPPIRIWEVESGKVITYIQDAAQSRGLSFDRDGGRLAVATGTGKTILICDSNTGAILSTLRGHINETMCVAFHPDGTRLVSGSRDGAVKLWNAKSQPLKLKHAPRKTEMPWITGVAADRNGTRVITASRDNTVQMWDADQGDLIRIWEGPVRPEGNWRDVFWSVAITPDGRQVFAGHARGTILRWDVETGEALPSLTKAGRWLVQALAISADGRWLASSADDRFVRLWSLPSGELVRSIPTNLAGETVTCLEFSPDSSKLVGGSGNLTFLDSPSGIGLWDVASGEPLWSVAAAPVSMRDVAFSPDGRMLIAALNDGRILVHDPSTGLELASFSAHAGNAFAAAFTPDSRRLITGGTDGVKVWDPEDWSEVFVYRDESVLCLALGDGGRKLVFGGYYPTAIVLDSTPAAQGEASDAQAAASH
jgi:WD40 repeat protein/serine/threonine protein kinase